MTDLIKFLENNKKQAVYTGGNIHGIYFYLEMIGAPTISTTSYQCSHNFGPSCCTNNDTGTKQPVIEALHIRQNIICEFCERIGHKSDACIIHGPKSLPPIIIIKANKLNALHDYEPNDPPREWNGQPPADHFKSRTSPTKTNTVVSAIIGRLNHHAINNGDVDVHPSGFSAEFNPESVTDTDTILIKKIDYYEMVHLLKLFHLEYNADTLDVELQVFQA